MNTTILFAENVLLFRVHITGVVDKLDEQRWSGKCDGNLTMKMGGIKPILLSE